MTVAAIDYRVIGVEKEELFMRCVIAQATGQPAEFDAINLHDLNSPPTLTPFKVTVNKYDATPPKTFEVTDHEGNTFTIAFKQQNEHIEFEVFRT